MFSVIKILVIKKPPKFRKPFESFYFKFTVENSDLTIDISILNKRFQKFKKLSLLIQISIYKRYWQEPKVKGNFQIGSYFLSLHIFETLLSQQKFHPKRIKRSRL